MKAIEACIAHLNRVTNENVLYRGSDRDGDILVLDQAGIRILTFDTIFHQSAYFPQRPFTHAHEYTRAMMMVLVFITPRHITLLGLGGGTLLRTAHHYLPLCHFHVVEKRSLVYDIAKDYFGIPNGGRVEVFINDAMKQLELMESASTEVIFSDIYGAFGASPLQATLRFFRECARVLTATGWLVVNCERSPEKNAGILEFISDCFEEIHVCACAYGNHIVFACKSSPANYEQAEKRLIDLEDAHSEPYAALFRRLRRLGG